MALSRKFLSAMGLEDDKIEQIIQAHSETVTALKDERDTYKLKADELEGVKAELDKTKGDLDALKNQPGDGYKEKYEQTKAEFDKFKADAENERVLAAKKTAYADICKDAGLSERGLEKALKYADWASIELDDAGKVKDGKAHIKTLKDDWAEYIVKESATGANTPTPPANTGGNTMSVKDIMGIKDDTARQRAIAQNHELFGF